MVAYNRAFGPDFVADPTPQDDMPDLSPKIRDIAWSEMFPWTILLRSVRISLLSRVLVLGALGLLFTTLGWTLITKVFSHSPDPVIAAWSQQAGRAMWNDPVSTHASDMWVNSTARSVGDLFESELSLGLLRAPISIWLYLTRPFIQMFDRELTAMGFLFLVTCIVWELLVWGLFGGAITRVAALKFTRDEAPGLIAALKHSAAKLPSYSLPPLIALAGTSVFALQLVVLGFFMRVDVLAFLAALAWPFVLLLGLMMAILLLGALAGWPLMWATVSVEGTDAFDALSRSYAYTYHRPWRLLWYVFFAGFLAVASIFVVKLFASSAILLGNWSVRWGLDRPTFAAVVRGAPDSPTLPPAPPKMEVVPGASDAPTEPPSEETRPEPKELSGIEKATLHVINFWKGVMGVLVAGYQAGFLWVSAVGIYLLLRHDIDGVQLNEVYIDQDEEYGLPPLVEDPATGVPEVNPHGTPIAGDQL